MPPKKQPGKKVKTQPKARRVVVGIQEIASIMDVSAVTIRKWAGVGMPQEARGQYDVAACQQWWRDTIDAGRDESGKVGETLTDVRTQYWKAKAEDAEIDVATKRGKLIPVSEVDEQWCRRVSEVRQGLLSLETRLPPIVEGKSLREIRNAIKIEVDALLDGYARSGKFCQVRK